MIAMVLVGFVLVTAAVIWRRGYGTAQAIGLRDLDRRRAQLTDETVALERQVHGLAARARLAPIVEQRLGMRVPDDSQVVVLPVPAAASTKRVSAAAEDRGGGRP